VVQCIYRNPYCCNFFWIYSKSGTIRPDGSVSVNSGSGSEHTATSSHQQGIDAQLKKICSCESGWQHYESDGITVRRGKINTDDIGICQINQKHWSDEARRLGVNLFVEEDNIQMARWIYERYGTQPWNWSKECWSR